MNKVNKQQIIMLSIGGILIIFLALMPKAVIKNQGGEGNEEKAVEATMTKETHDAGVSEEDLKKIDELRSVYLAEEDVQLKRRTLDSLEVTYKSINRFDSAAYYLESFALENNDDSYLFKAGKAYYDAFTFAVNEDRVKLFETKTRSSLGKYIEGNPEASKVADANVMIGMTYVRSENPMQGILKIREVLQQNPNNEMALNNMGLLAIQSGQFDKAITRFEKLVKLYPQNAEYRYYYGVSLHETGNEEASHEQFDWVEKHADDPLLREAAAKNKH